MDPERWHRVSDLFHRALERDPDSRAMFLDEECRDDPSLREEVASLLTFHEQSGGGIDTPTHLAAPESSSDPPATSLIGHSLNQYSVTRKLGQGGMGVVYLADDTRLGRPVALKALTHQFTQDSERRERLRREARAAAGLSHPGIATVYALEEFDDDLFIVSEYVPGHTLRDEVAGGPLPLAPLLTTALEIARALAAAHERGVVHRDLKPENVIRTPDGSIKVLDFGLARISYGGTAPSGTQLTEPGAVLGTPGYISPEQLRGTGADFRADLFSFGVMVYELAAGRHPFSSPGSNPASTIARVLEAEPPDVADLNPACPPALESLIHRCLRKEPEQRYESTDEVVAVLDRLRRDLDDRPAEAAAPPVDWSGHQTRRSRATSVWWWQLHQVLVGAVYYLALIPMWIVRQQAPAPWGPVLFFSMVAAVGIAATLRFHLWFTSRFNPTELALQRQHVFWPIRLGDMLFVLLLLASSVLMATRAVALTALLVGLAVASVIAFLVIEPSSTRAAFRS